MIPIERQTFRLVHSTEPGRVVRGKVGGFAGGYGQGLELRDREQLIDESGHAGDVLAQHRQLAAFVERLEVGRENGKRRPQLVRRIGGEFALSTETFIETIESAGSFLDGGGSRPCDL